MSHVRWTPLVAVQDGGEHVSDTRTESSHCVSDAETRKEADGTSLLPAHGVVARRNPTTVCAPGRSNEGNVGCILRRTEKRLDRIGDV
jgi:hypothetical protein